MRVATVSGRSVLAREAAAAGGERETATAAAMRSQYRRQSLEFPRLPARVTLADGVFVVRGREAFLNYGQCAG